MIFLILYLITVNALAFLIMLMDKRRARKKLWRIPESTLFTVALLGGSIGALTGMYCFRHKTKHFKYLLGLPTLLIVNLLALYYIVKLI